MLESVRLTFQIGGLDCAGCAKTVELGVAQLPGVTSSELNFTTERLTVVGTVPRELIVARVVEMGYTVVEPTADGAMPEAPAGFLAFMWGRTETRLALLGGLLMLPGLLLGEIGQVRHPLIDAASLGALALAGWPVARSAWRGLRAGGQISINLLMTVAAVGAVLIGAITEAGMVMVLFALGEALEGYTAGRARQSIRSLMQVAPSTALRLSSHGGHDHEQQVPVAELRVGDVVVVRPGERVPMDGSVRAGTSSISQAAITGESRLIDKAPGDEVFAGSINGEGSLEVVVSRLAADNTISRMLALVEEAQERKAPAQRYVDSFARWYTPAVMVLSALTMIVPPLLFGQPFLNPPEGGFGWLYRGLALLVVACPCALVISTPVSVISALSNAARSGLLIKGGAALESLSRVRAVAFDKTGTLTAGTPQVVAIRSADCRGFDGELCAPCTEVLALANAVERRSEHPLARAIVRASQERGLSTRYLPAEGVTALTGQGVRGQVGELSVLIGSHAAFEGTIPHPAAHCAAARQEAALGHTAVLVSADTHYLGMISLADTIRPSSQGAVAALRALGLRAVVMLSGDDQETARRVGEEIGVTDVRAGLLPAQKLALVEELQRQYGPIAMVGDGINDTPALAAASVGIAVGGAHGGTAQAMETADVTLMSDDLGRLPFLLRLARAMMATIRANVAVSIAIKLAFLILVLLGVGTMWMAVISDVGVALLVTLNGMRLLGRPTIAGSTERNA
ncbi:cadmium-translocating P-type ATPase [Chloroflexales bacterium ZM16-3]|nr:cadmium-translocating P-type ATPase [Chloroflexales bacterium ZM16-3]